MSCECGIDIEHILCITVDNAVTKQFEENYYDLSEDEDDIDLVDVLSDNNTFLKHMSCEIDTLLHKKLSCNSN